MPMAPEPMTKSDFGMPVGHHGLEISPDQLLVRLEAGQHARPRTGSDDDVFGLIGAGPSAPFGASLLDAFTVTLPGASMDASPQITETLFFFIRKPTPSLSRFDTPRERFTMARRVVADIVGCEPIVLGVLHVMEDLRRAQQRLGRDAAPIEADASQIIALDDRRLEAKLRRTNGGDIAARTGADDYDIEDSSQPSFVSCMRDMLTRLGFLAPLQARSRTSLPRRSHTAIITGCSISALKAASSLAPSAPSTTRWSQESVTVMIVAISICRSVRRVVPRRRRPREGGLRRIDHCGEILDAIHAEIGDRLAPPRYSSRLQLARAGALGQFLHLVGDDRQGFRSALRTAVLSARP